MGFTNFPYGITSMGIPQVGASVPTTGGNYWFVDGTNGVNGNSGKSFAQAFQTITRAMSFVSSGDVVCIAKGTYDETLTISRVAGLPTNLTFVGCANRGGVAIAPTTTNANGVVNDCDDVTFINVGMAANGTGTALVNTGSRLRVYGCKLENDDGTGASANMTLGTVAQDTAETKGTGADCLFYDSEFAWSATGINLTCTDYGAVTELFIQNCRFHDLGTAHMAEVVGSGGSAGVMFAGLHVTGCVFVDGEGGTPPTNFLLLNGDNANDGIVANNAFGTAVNSGLNLVSTQLLWVSNYHTGGVSTGQPS